MSKEELLTSINEYRSQLLQVETTIALCTNPNQIDSLENLKKDLTELLDLTTEQLDELDEPNGQSTDPYEDEMKLFLSEIRSVEQTEAVDDNFQLKVEAIKVSGYAVRIPKVVVMFKNPSRERIECNCGKEIFGTSQFLDGRAFHNAFVCSLDDTTDYDETIDLDTIKVKVLFINPTHRDMVPCSYFLDGSCKFDSDRCHYSHGELVLYKELRDYKEPNFQILQQIKCPVLVKQSDRIWHKGRILSSNFDDKTCTVKLEENNKEICCDFQDILPIHCDNTSLDESSSDSESYIEEYEPTLVERTLLNPLTNEVLGDWEKYTKGFGSRMLQKFGYIHGTGLGNNGEGIVDPIRIQILPTGKSLDYCMELRERANGDQDFFNIDRKLKKQQKKQELINTRAYERDRQSGSNVFSFLNDNILASLGSCSETNLTPEKQSNSNPKFESHSTKNLNVAAFKIGEDIKKMEKDIQNLRNSMARQQRDTPVYNKLSGQLNLKNLELNKLKKSEKSVASEQTFRKDKSKLTIF